MSAIFSASQYARGEGGQAASDFKKEKWFIHLLFSFLQVDNHEFVIREATLGESQADAVRVGRAATAVQSESRGHFGVMQ